MLDDQSYDGHASVHDDATAASLGLAGAPIEGPDPLQPVRPAGRRAVGRGLVRAGLHQQPLPDDGRRGRAGAGVDDDGERQRLARSRPTRPTARRCSSGTASVGPDHPESELAARRGRPGRPRRAVHHRPARGRHAARRRRRRRRSRSTSRTGRCTRSRWPRRSPRSPSRTRGTRRRARRRRRGAGPIVPFEMLSVLTNKSRPGLPGARPGARAVPRPRGAHARGPGVRRRALRDPPRGRRAQPEPPHRVVLDRVDDHRAAARAKAVAIVLLHQGVFKESYAGYPRERLAS